MAGDLQKPWKFVDLQVLCYFKVSPIPHSELLLALIFPRRKENSSKKGLGPKFRTTEKWALRPEMAPGQPGKMAQDSGSLNSWVEALLVLSSGSSRPGFGLGGETQKYSSPRAFRDHQKDPTHVTERETEAWRGEVMSPRSQGRLVAKLIWNLVSRVP